MSVRKRGIGRKKENFFRRKLILDSMRNKIAFFIIVFLFAVVIVLAGMNVFDVIGKYGDDKKINEYGIGLSPDEQNLDFACQTLVINDGDPYIEENINDPDWVWILRNLNSNQKTEINSPSDLIGPIVGIGNKFVATNLNEKVLKEPFYSTSAAASTSRNYQSMNDWLRLQRQDRNSINENNNGIPDNVVFQENSGGSTSGNYWYDQYDKWSLPNDYVKFTYFGIYPDDYVDWVGERGALEIKTKIETIDTTQAIGVPLEYQSYLKQDARVVSVKVNNPRLAPYDSVPVIMTNYQERHMGVGESVWADDVDTDFDNISYYLDFMNVNSDFSLDFGVVKVDCNFFDENEERYCEYSHLENEDFNLPLKQEKVFRNKKIYNFMSANYSEEERNKEWAIVYDYNIDTQRTTEKPTSNLVIQSFNEGNNERGGTRVLVFYKDPETNELVFDKSIFYLDFSRYYYIDYYYGSSQIELRATNYGDDKNFWGLLFTSQLYWPSSENEDDNIFAKFKTNQNGEFVSLGKFNNVAEVAELEYSYNFGWFYSNINLNNYYPSYTIYFYQETYTIELVSASDTSAIVKVTDENGNTETKEVNENSFKVILGLTIGVRNADSNNLGHWADIVVYPNPLDLTQIGAKNIDTKTAHGVKISNPSQNSQNEEMIFYLYNQKPYAKMALETLRHKIDYMYVQFGENIFLFPDEGENYYPKWLYDYTNSYYSYYDEEINQDVIVEKLNRYIDNYNGSEINSHEALVFGNNTPRIETSLTSGKDEYKDKVYVETQSAYSENDFIDEGIKYLHAFDDSVDLTQLSETNSMSINFLGDNLKLIEYLGERSLRLEYCPYGDCVRVLAEKLPVNLTTLGSGGTSLVFVDAPELVLTLTNVNEDSSIVIMWESNENTIEYNIAQGDFLIKDGFIIKNVQSVWHDEFGKRGTILDVYDIRTCEHFCGNGVWEEGEGCDDGNLKDEDGCSKQCENEFCGDWIVQEGLGEECDDGNRINGDGCSESCRFIGCGIFGTDNGDGTCTAEFTATAESGTIYQRRSSNNALDSWNEVHESSSGYLSLGVYNDIWYNVLHVGTLYGYFSANVYEISRMFLVFDSSTIPDYAEINVAELIVNPTFVGSDDIDGNDYIAVVQSEQSNPAQLTEEDFDQLSDQLLSDKVYLNSVIANQDKIIQLNQEGILAINKDGFTLLGMREGHDIENDPITPISNPVYGAERRNLFNLFTETGNNVPKLRIIYNKLPECGNLLIETGEECDDGNIINEDGCSSTCSSEAADEPLEELNGVNKNRYISFVPNPNNAGTNTAIRVMLSSLYKQNPSRDFSTFEGQYRWVGPPGVYNESSSDLRTFNAAQLQCEPYYADWSNVNLLHVYGSEIIPSSTYVVQAIKEGCNINKGICYSRELEILTAKWGDIVAPFWPSNPPTDQPNVFDVASIVDNLKSVTGAPPKIRAKLQPNIPNASVDISALDIVLVVDALKGKGYPYPGPIACGETNEGSSVVINLCGNFMIDNGETCDPPGIEKNCVVNGNTGKQRCLDSCLGYGECIITTPTCTNECSTLGTKQCSGNGYITCGNYDSDSCLEWSSVNSCATGQTCSNGACQVQIMCGNNILEENEQCDDGNTNNNDACKNDCKLNVCGDGVIYNGIESCDDGNIINGDGCSFQCLAETKTTKSISMVKGDLSLSPSEYKTKGIFSNVINEISEFLKDLFS